MDRRWSGIVLLVTALAAAVVVGSVPVKQVAGWPVVAPPSGPPVVGDCVDNVSAGYPTEADIVSCERPHQGEVVALLSIGQTAPDARRDDGTDALPGCQQAVARYLGAPGAEAGGTDPAWQPVAAISPVVIRPSQLQQALGSSWLACAVAVDRPDRSYDGTVRDSQRTGAYPPALARCSLPSDRSSVDRSCADDHWMEVFGVLTRPQGTLDRPRLVTACAELVTFTTGMSDPTAAGRLVVDVVRDESAGRSWITVPSGGRIAPGPLGPLTMGQPGDRIPPGQAGWVIVVQPGQVTRYVLTAADVDTYYCVVRVTGAHRLTGPLLGLHGGPLPIG